MTWQRTSEYFGDNHVYSEEGYLYTMNIKKIILEEINDFDWISDTPDMDNYNNVHFMYNGVRYHVMDRGGDNVLIYDDEGNSLQTPYGSKVWSIGLVDRMFNSDSFVVTS